MRMRPSSRLATAASSVAAVPTKRSTGPRKLAPVAAPTALVMAQPSPTPQMAAGLMTGSRVRTSATRHCTAPKLMGASASESAA